MLVHIGQYDVAERVHNGWLKTLEDGVHTYDIFKEGISKEKVGTSQFAEAVIARLGQKPSQLKAVTYQAPPSKTGEAKPLYRPTVPAKKELKGVDVFIHNLGISPDDLGAKLEALQLDTLPLQVISNRGQKVYPKGFAETFCTDHWRCRFAAPDNGNISHSDIIELLRRIDAAGLDFIKTEHLCTFDGEKGWTAAQGT
jgi:isocitrate dehydrogenase